jgi:hypothetical protein
LVGLIKNVLGAACAHAREQGIRVGQVLSTKPDAVTIVAFRRFNWENLACWVNCWKSVDIPIAGIWGAKYS